jgi:hypothetical protein
MLRRSRVLAAVAATVAVTGLAQAPLAAAGLRGSSGRLRCATQTSGVRVLDTFNRRDSNRLDTTPGCSDTGHQWVDASNGAGHLHVRSQRLRGTATDETGRGDYVTNGATVNDALSRYAVEADFYPSPTPNRCALQMLVTEPAPHDRIYVNGGWQPVPYGFIHVEMSKYFEQDIDGSYHLDGTDALVLIVKSPQTTGYYYAAPNPAIHFTPGGGPYRIRAELDGQFVRVYADGRLVITMDLTNPGPSGPTTPWDQGFFAAMSNHGLHISAGVGGGGGNAIMNWADDLGSSFENFAVRPLP